MISTSPSSQFATLKLVKSTLSSDYGQINGSMHEYWNSWLYPVPEQKATFPVL